LKSRKDRNGNRLYHLNKEGDNEIIRQEVLDCIEAKLTQPKEKIDWESAINEAHGAQTDKTAETETEQGLEVTAPSPNFLYTNYIEGAVNNSTSKSHDVELLTTAEVGGEVLEAVVQKSELEQLVEALPLAETVEGFASIVGGSPLETVEDAIALSADQPRRIQLQAWLDALNQPVREVEPQPLKPRSWQWSELPAVKSILRWIDRSEQVRLLAIDASGLCQVRSLLSGLTTNTHASQLMPVSG
jgi:hypothetical protein